MIEFVAGGVNSTGSGAQPTPMATSQPQAAAASDSRPMATGTGQDKVLDRQRLQELVKEVDPLEQLDEEVEEVLYFQPTFFLENFANKSVQFAFL